MKNRVLYLDVLKTIAICAVLVDHFSVLFPRPYEYRVLSHFSVSVFIIVAGFSSYIAMPKHFETLAQKSGGTNFFIHRMSSLFLTYVVACILNYAYMQHGNLNSIENYMHLMLRFSMPAPAYYIVVYAELTMAAPILYLMVRKSAEGAGRYVKLAGVLLISLGIGYYLTVKGPSFNVMGGAAVLLGGSYLFLYLFGMVCAALDLPQIVVRFRYLWVGSILSIAFCAWWIINRGFAISVFPIWRVNPPGVVLMFYAISVFFGAAGLVCRLEKSEKLRRHILNPAAGIGRYSLDIFLFHLLIYEVVYNHTPLDGSRPYEKVLLFLIPLMLPILVRKGYTEIKKKIRAEYWVLASMHDKDNQR